MGHPLGTSGTERRVDGGMVSSIADSRKLVLERIRAASRSSAAIEEKSAVAGDQIERGYVRRGTMSAGTRQELFIERLREYDAEVVECSPEEVAATIAAQLTASGKHKFVAPPGLPPEWLAKGFDWNVDDGLTAGEVEQCEGVITACFCGVAESGTIVLHHSATEGRRVITLLPDWHLCIVRASQIVETLPEYFDKCREQGNRGTREPEGGQQGIGNREQKVPELPRLVTWISGPSATADIEMTRIKGVHGPRFLHVIVVS